MPSSGGPCKRAWRDTRLICVGKGGRCWQGHSCTSKCLEGHFLGISSMQEPQAVNGASCSGYVCSGKCTLGTDLKQELQVVNRTSFSGCVGRHLGTAFKHEPQAPFHLLVEVWVLCAILDHWLIHPSIHPSICQSTHQSLPTRPPAQGPAIPGACGFLYDMERPHGGQDHCAAHTRPGGHAGPHHVPLRAGVRSLCHAVCVLRLARASIH